MKPPHITDNKLVVLERDLQQKSILFSKWAVLLVSATLLLLTACQVTQAVVPVNITPAEKSEVVRESSEPTPKSSIAATASGSNEAVPEVTLTATRHTGVSPTATIRPKTTATATLEIVSTPTDTQNRSSDLLYLINSNLMRWNYLTNSTRVLAENIADYAVSHSGRYIALLKSTNITANGIELFQLSVLDLSNLQETKLLESTPRLKNIGISSNGAWVNYQKNQDNSEIFVIRNDDQGEIHNLGECVSGPDSECKRPVWSSDGQSVLWIDKNGIWTMSIWDMNSRLIHPAKITVLDPKGKEQEIQVRFDHPRWSPTGRYVLLEIIPSDEGVHWQGLLDTRSGRLVEVPDSFQYIKSGACAAWTEDGKILVGHSGDTKNQIPPQIKRWDIVPTKDDLLISGANYEVSSDMFPSSSGTEDETDHLFPNWLENISESSAYFGLSDLESSTPPILLKLDLETGKIAEIIVVPYAANKVIWSPDGSGAVVMSDKGEMLFAPFDGSLMQDLHKLLGENAGDLTWLPPQTTPSS